MMMLLMPHILAWHHDLQPCQSKTQQQHWVGRGSGVTVLVRQASKVCLQLLFSIIYWHNGHDKENFSPHHVIWVDSNVTRRDPSLITVFCVHQQPRPPFLSCFKQGRADLPTTVSLTWNATVVSNPCPHCHPSTQTHKTCLFYMSGCLLPQSPTPPSLMWDIGEFTFTFNATRGDIPLIMLNPFYFDTTRGIPLLSHQNCSISTQWGVSLSSCQILGITPSHRIHNPSLTASN